MKNEYTGVDVTEYGATPDADPSQRPGVPMRVPPSGEVKKPHDLPEQRSSVEVLKGYDVPQMPPCYGTAQPPRGLSGVLRRRAYKIPEHLASRWMTLLLADRVDVWESRMRRHPFLSAGIALGLVGAFAARPRR